MTNIHIVQDERKNLLIGRKLEEVRRGSRISSYKVLEGELVHEIRKSRDNIHIITTVRKGYVSDAPIEETVIGAEWAREWVTTRDYAVLVIDNQIVGLVADWPEYPRSGSWTSVSNNFGILNSGHGQKGVASYWNEYLETLKMGRVDVADLEQEAQAGVAS